jgi:hypothetical protein
MSRIRGVLILLLTLVLLVSGATRAIAQDATPAASPEASPTTQVTITAPGGDYGDWAAAWGQWLFSFPTAVSPAADTTGAGCGLGQTGSAFVLATSAVGAGPINRACTIVEGTSVLVPVIAVNCSTAEADPFHGDDADSLASCATTNADAVTDGHASVDGTDVADISSYRTQSAVFNVVLPEGNMLSAPAGAASAVVEGAFLNLEDLATGDHTISFGGTYGAGGAIDITYTITVVPAPVTAS